MAIDRFKPIISKNWDVAITIRPRPKPRIPGKAIKPPWDFNKSIFASYKPDNEELLNECFEMDWKNSKMLKLLKKEEELYKVKMALKKSYPVIK